MQQNTEKHVTNRNGVQLAGLAREHGVPRENFVEFLNDKKRVKRFFDEELMGKKTWFEVLQAEAKKIGARVHLIPNLEVDYTKSHNEAALAGGPQTPSKYNVLKVAYKYEPSESKRTAETIVILNWENGGGSYDKAIEFGLKNGLDRTTPHMSFAIGETLPKLNYKLGSHQICVIETTGCMLDNCLLACSMWWSDAERTCDLCWQKDYDDYRCWFAFRKK